MPTDDIPCLKSNVIKDIYARRKFTLIRVNFQLGIFEIELIKLYNFGNIWIGISYSSKIKSNLLYTKSSNLWGEKKMEVLCSLSTLMLIENVPVFYFTFLKKR